MYAMHDSYLAQSWTPEIVWTVDCAGHECGIDVLTMHDEPAYCAECAAWIADAMAEGERMYRHELANRNLLSDATCPACGEYGYMDSRLVCRSHACAVGDA